MDFCTTVCTCFAPVRTCAAQNHLSMPERELGGTLDVALHDDNVSAAQLSDQNQPGKLGASPNIIVFGKKFSVRAHELTS